MFGRWSYLTPFAVILSISLSLLFIRKMLKTLEDVTDSGSHICALDKG
jgi:hypothetical protein